MARAASLFRGNFIVNEISSYIYQLLLTKQFNDAQI